MHHRQTLDEQNRIAYYYSISWTERVVELKRNYTTSEKHRTEQKGRDVAGLRAVHAEILCAESEFIARNRFKRCKFDIHFKLAVINNLNYQTFDKSFNSVSALTLYLENLYQYYTVGYPQPSSQELAADRTVVNKVHEKLVALTTEYLKDRKIQYHSGRTELLNKADIFEQLSVLLDATGKSKYEMIRDYTRLLAEADKSLLGKHRHPALARYIVNALSILMVLPAMVRMYKSYSNYNTLCFWKPDSQKTKEYALAECRKVLPAIDEPANRMSLV